MFGFPEGAVNVVAPDVEQWFSSQLIDKQQTGRGPDFFRNDSEEKAHLSTEALPCVGEGLRSHESRSASGAGQQSVAAFKLVADPKVCYLHVAIIAQQEVRGLDIPVDDLLVVH